MGEGIACLYEYYCYIVVLGFCPTTNLIVLIVVCFYKQSGVKYRSELILYCKLVNFTFNPKLPPVLILRDLCYANISKYSHGGVVGSNVRYVIFREFTFNIRDLPGWERKVSKLLKGQGFKVKGGKIIGI